MILYLLQYDMANYKRVYEEGYSYFITMVTHRRQSLLIKNIDLLRKSFAYSKRKFDYHIEEIVILPDHLHMIMTPVNVEEYPKIIGTIKSYFSRHVDIEDAMWLQQSKSRQKQRYKPVWQRRYYEHVIRDEKDYREKIEYMQNNPVKHGLTGDILAWEYSSFFKRKVSAV